MVLPTVVGSWSLVAPLETKGGSGEPVGCLPLNGLGDILPWVPRYALSDEIISPSLKGVNNAALEGERDASP